MALVGITLAGYFTYSKFVDDNKEFILGLGQQHQRGATKDFR
jgi:hypothetical protein